MSSDTLVNLLIFAAYIAGSLWIRARKRKRAEQAKAAGGSPEAAGPAPPAEAPPVALPPPLARPAATVDQEVGTPPEAAPAQAALARARDRWREVARPVLTRDVATRIERLVERRFPSLGISERVEPGEAPRMRELASAIEELTRLVGAAESHLGVLTWRLVDDLVAGILEAQYAGSGGSLPPVTVPVAREPSAAASRLCAEVKLLPVAVTTPNASPVMQGLLASRRAVRDALMRDLPSVQAMLALLRQELVAAVTGGLMESKKQAGSPGQGGFEPVRDLLLVEGSNALLLNLLAERVVIRHTGPMEVLVDRFAGEPLPGDVVHSLRRFFGEAEVAETAYAHIAQACDEVLERVPLGGDLGRSVVVATQAWGPAEIGWARRTRAWIERKRDRRPAERIPARAVWVAWLEAAASRPALAADPAWIRRLHAAVEGLEERGDLAASEAAAADLAPPRGARSERALLLQILLGPPLARAHPLLRSGPRRLFPNPPPPAAFSRHLRHTCGVISTDSCSTCPGHDSA